MFFCVVSASRPWQMQFSVPFRRGCGGDRALESDRLRHKNALRSSRNQPCGLPLAGGRNQRPGGGPHFDHLHVEGRAQPEYWQAPGCVCLFKRPSLALAPTHKISLACSQPATTSPRLAAAATPTSRRIRTRSRSSASASATRRCRCRRTSSRVSPRARRSSARRRAIRATAPSRARARCAPRSRRTSTAAASLRRRSSSPMVASATLDGFR